MATPLLDASALAMVRQSRTASAEGAVMGHPNAVGLNSVHAEREGRTLEDNNTPYNNDQKIYVAAVQVSSG
jgi:hypothetical protein